MIRIANGQGFWGDSIDAPVNLIEYGKIDYLTLDYLAEVTLSIMQRQKLKNPKAGYAKDFITFIERVLPMAIDKNIKIITNAGGINSYDCREALLDVANSLGVDVKIAVINGDDILDRIDIFIDKGENFKNLENNLSFDNVRDNIYSANVYIDSFSIADALSKGADIVLAGRVSDPGLALGPCIYEFGWMRDDWDLLAAGTLAGHITECGAQCTGGNYSNWKDVPDMANIGYPIIEMNKNGSFYITKPKGTGGIVNKLTVTEQILYEMGDPNCYISPDVCVDFTSFNIKEVEKNRVYIENVKGFKSTDTFKVSMSYFAGYKASGQLTISGPDAYEKSKLVAQIIWDRLKNAGFEFQETNSEFLGLSPVDINDRSNQKNLSEIVLRLSVRDESKYKVNRFGMEIAPVITNGPPGITGFSGGRPKAQEIIAYWPTLIDKKNISVKSDVL